MQGATHLIAPVPKRSRTKTPDDAQTHQAGGIHLHVNVPDRIAEVLVQLVAAISTGGLASRSSFPDLGSAFGESARSDSNRREHGRRFGQIPREPQEAEPEPTEEFPEQDAGTGDSEVLSTDVPGSLLAAYQQKMLAKRQRSAGKKAIAEHLSSCRSFDAFCAAEIHHRFSTPIGNLRQVLKTPDILQLYAQWSIVQNDHSRITTNKRIGHISMAARDACGIKLDRPTPKELKKIEDSKAKKASDGRRIPSFQEVDRLAAAVAVARWPYRDHAPYFWRGLIRFSALFGFRTQDVVSLSPEKPGLCKSDVIWQTECPIADVNNALGYDLHSPHGWLHYAIGKDTHSDCRRILVPMPKWLRDWVRFFSELSDHPQRIFPSMKQAALDSKAFGREWKRIVKQAEVDPRIMLSEGTGNRIALRKYAANWWTLASLKSKNHAAISDKIGHYVLHHAEVTTATKHYLSTQAAVLPAMLELLPAWPLPAAGAAPVCMLPE